MTKLTDTHLVMLSAASQREDGLVTVPEKLKGGAAKVVATKLISLGLIKETAVKGDAPSWRVNEEGRAIGLKITAAGLAAIGVSGETPIFRKGQKSSRVPKAVHEKSGSKPRTEEPQRTSKQALIVSLLQRPNGATLKDLIDATGWLPHTTRAALTGLRKRGHAIQKSRTDDATTIYNIAAELNPAAKQEETSLKPSKAA